jgi:AbrB family looped-hinge helix DNA binding protein
MSTPLEVGPQGRIVIPSAIRKQMGIEVGSTLVASVVDGKLVLETQGQLLNQFYSRFAKARMKPDLAVADALIAERRTEAAHE